MFDPSPQIARIGAGPRQAALAAAHWISANRAEAATLTGHDDPALAAQALSARPGGAVVRDGARGAWLALPGGPALHIPPHPVHPVDTNGAGDAHVGAFIAALAAGHPPVDACSLANIAAALSTTREGPATAPSLAEVLAQTGTPPAHDPYDTQQEA